MNIKKLNESLSKLLEYGYDDYLAQCIDNYTDPKVSEFKIYGTSLYDIEAENGEETKVFKNVPMEYSKWVDISDDYQYPPRWSAIENNIDDYFDLGEIDNFEILDATSENETQVPEDYSLVSILGFSDGHSFNDLEVES